MTGLPWLGFVAVIVTFATMPFVRFVMLKQGVLDVPNHRSSHQVPIPRGGGIACALGVVTSAVVATVAGLALSWAAVVAALALAVVGFVDDQFHLPVLPRLASQVLVGAAVGLTLGDVVWAGIGALLLPLVVNVVNFMDGINGITAITAGVWGVTALVSGHVSGTAELAALGALVIGAALGFLPWNVPHAKVFLGDVGSYLFGGLLGSGILVGASGGVSPVILAAPLAVYFTDVGLTLLRRALRGASLFEAHRDHIYQRLVHQVGVPHGPVALGTGMLATLISWAWSTWSANLASVLTISLLAAYVASGTIAGVLRASQVSQKRDVEGRSR